MAASPALDVAPERPMKRLKLSSAPHSNGDTPHDSDADSTPPSRDALPVVDLAEQQDSEERSKYVKGAKIGSGQYADVFSAHLASDPTKIFAIKKIKVGPEVKDTGISYDTLREIKFLQELHHENIITLHAVFSNNAQNLNLVLEYLPQGDLLKLVQDTQNISYTPADIKMWMLMLCRAVWFCHANFVLHRDIKPNNLLIAADGSIKLADFGLARSFADPGVHMTYNTITLWYRPPELFFQAPHYCGKVDVWSCGAVFCELIQRVPMFRAIPETELNMIKLISEKVGTPTEDNWPGVSKFKGYLTPGEVQPLRPKEYWRQEFKSVGDVGVDLLMKMLELDPRKRLNAEQVLRHEFWTADPRPSRLADLPRKGGGGPEVMGEDLTRRGGKLPGREKDKVARKLDFGSMR